MKDIILMQIIPVSVFIAVFVGVLAASGCTSFDPAASVVSLAVATPCHLVVFFGIGEYRIKQELKKIK